MAPEDDSPLYGVLRYLLRSSKEVLILILGIVFCLSVNGASIFYLQSYEAQRAGSWELFSSFERVQQLVVRESSF